MWGNLIRFGSYAYAFKELGNLVTRSRSSRLQELQRSKNLNMLLGLGLGTAIGVSTGLLVAPRSGRETRAKLAGQTNEIMGSLRESAHDIKERVRLKSQRAALDARESVEDARESVRESVREAAEKR